MPKVKESNEEISIIEKMPNGLRIFLSIGGLIPIILAPYELLIRPGWNGLSLYLIFPIFISLGAILVGCLIIATGLFGLNQTLIFAAKSRTIYYSYDSTLIPLRLKSYKFSDIDKILINPHDWSDGPSTYSLQLIFINGQKIETGNFKTKNEAGLLLNKVAILVGKK